MNPPDNDLFRQYLKYCSGTEVPPLFDRWSFITALGAWLGRSVWIEFGNSQIYPNLYTILLGASGTKKSTSIKRAKRLLSLAGYEHFAAQKTSKEKFLLDLSGKIDDTDTDSKDVLITPFADADADKEIFIVADEFNEFFGNNILDFASTLGDLWDYVGVYKNRIKNGQSVEIPNPTVSVLGGNTQERFADTFPPELVGQGFFSRILPIYAKPTGLRITWPRKPEQEEEERLVEFLQTVKVRCTGELTLSDEAKTLIEKIYVTWVPLRDLRFAYYSNRRLPQLLKLIAIHTVARLSQVVETVDVVYANTILTHSEHFMPDAFGAFGQAKNKAASYKVLQVIQNAKIGITVDELFKSVDSDVGGIDQLAQILRELTRSERIQYVGDKFLPKLQLLEEKFTDCVDYRFLTDEERSYV